MRFCAVQQGRTVVAPSVATKLAERVTQPALTAGDVGTAAGRQWEGQ